MKNVKIFGLGFAEVLTICFIVLKLLEKIDWSWVWVLAPLWISVGLAVVVGGAFLVFAILTD